MSYVLHNATVFDGWDIHPATSIKVVGQFITEVASSTSKPASTHEDTVTEIDLTGYTVLPGLIDAHTHLVGGDVVAGANAYGASRRMGEPQGLQALRTFAAAQRTLQAGFTTVRDMSGRDYLDVQFAQAVEEGVVTGPTLIPSGLGLTITGGHVHNRCVEVDGVDEVRKEVRRHIKQGARWIKLMGVTGGLSTVGRDPLAPQFTVEEIRAAVEEAHRAGVRVAAHAHGTEGIRNAVEGGVDSIEHGTYLTDDIAQRMAEQGTLLVPTLMNEMKFQEAVADGRVGETVVRQRALLAAQGRPIPSPEDRLAVARRHGVTVLVGTDCGGNALCRHGENANELLMLTRVGFSPLEALRAATGLAAKHLDLPYRGRIAEGCRADLVVCSTDVTRDLTGLVNKGGIAGVIKEGNLAHTTSPHTPLARLTNQAQETEVQHA